MIIMQQDADPTTDYLTATLVALASFLLFDSMYIGVCAKSHWQHQMKLMNSGKRLSISRTILSATFTYAVMIGAILGLVVSRVTDEESAFVEGIIWGALLGFSVYAIFNFTNLAIFPNYLFQTALMDTAWGTILMALTGALACYAATHWFLVVQPEDSTSL